MHPRPGPLRPIDLARAADLSTQQIRNYADEHILPSAPRTASGYRRFDHTHHNALLTYRALIPGTGAPTARRIMQTLHQNCTDKALELLDAAHADLHEQRTNLRTTARLLTDLAARTPGAPDPPTGDLRVGEAAHHLGVRPSTLRVWEAADLLHPRRQSATGYRLYTPQDVRRARMIHLLRQVRYPLPRIGPVLARIGEGAEPDALQQALDQRESDLAARSRALLAGAGALHTYLHSHPGAQLRTPCPG